MPDLVTLRFRGLMLEKFTERALKQGVEFDLIRRVGAREAILTTNPSGAAKVMILAERFALDVKITARRGPGVFLHRLWRRATLPAMLILCGALLLSFLSRAWLIDIRLIDEGSAAPIEQALLDMGIVPGTRFSDIDLTTLPGVLEARSAEFAYIGARRQGVRLLIEAAHAYAAPDLYNPKNTRDLVASTDALLVTLDVMAGTAAAKPGQIVRRGQVLIRGEERDGRETMRGVSALGAAIARVWVTGEADTSLERWVERDTGQTRVAASLCFLDRTIPLRAAEPFKTQRAEVERVPIGGILIPVYIERTVYIEQTRERTTVDPETAKAEISKIALDQAMARVPIDVSPVDKWVDYSMIEGGNLRARAVIEMRVNIAVDRAALNQT